MLQTGGVCKDHVTSRVERSRGNQLYRIDRTSSQLSSQTQVATSVNPLVSEKKLWNEISCVLVVK